MSFAVLKLMQQLRKAWDESSHPRNPAGSEAGGQFAASEDGQGMVAYHGSPHMFNKFSMKKVGSGEGSTTYGYGLYFTQDERVSQSYKDSPLTGGSASTGATYQVHLSIKPDEVLDWDEPIRGQSQKVRDLLGKQYDGWKDQSGQALYETISERLGGDKQASQFLEKNGIHAVRYTDRPAFTDGRVSHNLVVFNDKRITITHRDGKAIKQSELAKALQDITKAFDPDQPRDESGKWTGSGNSDLSASSPHVHAIARLQKLAGEAGSYADFVKNTDGERVLYRGALKDDALGNNVFMTDYVGHAKEYTDDGSYDSVKGIVFSPDEVMHFNDTAFDAMRKEFATMSRTELRGLYEGHEKLSAPDSGTLKAVESALRSKKPYSELVGNLELNDHLVPVMQKYAENHGKGIISFLGTDYADYGGQLEYVVKDTSKHPTLSDIWEKSKQHIAKSQNPLQPIAPVMERLADDDLLDLFAKNFDESEHPRDESGRFTSGSGASGGSTQLVSPSVEENTLSFEQSVQRFGSERQKQFDTECAKIDEFLGANSEVQNAVGAWTDGTENSTVQTMSGLDYNTLKYSAALKALYGQQKAAVVFQSVKGGSARMYELHVSHEQAEGGWAADCQSLAKMMDRAGIQNYTLLQAEQGTTIMVFDQHNEIYDKVRGAVGIIGADRVHFRQRHGIGELIGDTETWDRDKALDIYRNMIEQHESRTGKRYQYSAELVKNFLPIASRSISLYVNHVTDGGAQ